ncbi:MAG TPA: Crp/Fnr family transcriptional regulator [Pyrinomonadaceae bacterium]
MCGFRYFQDISSSDVTLKPRVNIMRQHSPQLNQFKENLRDLLAHEALNATAIKASRPVNIYTRGIPDDNVYFVESGQIKLLNSSLGDKDCLLAIYSSGDIFGELRLAGQSIRTETAVTMGEAVIKQIPYQKFLTLLRNHSMLEGFMQYLILRIAEQQELLSNFIAADCEQRLGEILLILAQKLGQTGPDGSCIKHRITHEELSEMVGTTRPRISQFMHRFRAQGLVELSAERFLIIKEKPLASYLTQIT